MQHVVTIRKTPALELAHSDLVIQVKERNLVLGNLHISKGAIEWKPKKGVHRKFKWRAFDSVMREWGKKKPRKRSTHRAR